MIIRPFNFFIFVCVCFLPSLNAQKLPNIEIVDNKFICEGKPWVALTMNYQVGVFTDDDHTFWVGPNHGYSADNKRCCNNPLDAQMALFADFARIREMGFNTVRICGLELFATPSSLDKKIWFKAKKGVDLTDVQILSSKRNNKQFAEMAKNIINEANEAGLQVIFLTGGANVQRVNIRDKYDDWLAILCDSIKKCQSVFAIDIYNEPIYSNTSNLGKMELHKVTKRWKSTIKKRVPKTWITIGLVGPEDAMGWDIDVVEVDFANYHLYPVGNNFEFVAATLYWLSKTQNKPWIVGETSYSGSNDSLQSNRGGSELDQKEYALFSLSRSLSLGAQGYGWWCYRDVYWNSKEDNMGVLTHQGKEKEVVSVFKNFHFSDLSKSVPLPDDLHYYHMQYSDYVVSGVVENQFGRPIPNAVICGWDAVWNNFRYTVTDKNGKYQLRSNTAFKFIKISALSHDVIHRTIVDVSKEIVLKTIVLKNWKDKQ